MNRIIVAFDLDDTLYKERYYVASGYNAVAKLSSRHDAADIMLAAWKMGNNPFDALKAIDPGIDISIAVATYRRHMPQIELPRASRYLLEYLQQHNVELYLITDGRAVGQTNKYKSLGLNRYIPESNVLISECTGHDKHDPDNFIAVMRRHDPADTFVYIGDNAEKDFLHPNRLGWTTIRLNDFAGENIHSQLQSFPEENRAKFEVDSLEDITKILCI